MVFVIFVVVVALSGYVAFTTHWRVRERYSPTYKCGYGNADKYRPMQHRNSAFGEKCKKKQYFINACELSSFLFPDDPPVPSNYELLKLPDVGLRSVYSGLNPYANTGGNAGLTSGKQDSVGYLHERL